MDQLVVFGLGRVGLPVAITAVEKGFKVSGVDIDEEKVSTINSGEKPWEDGESNEIADEINATTQPSSVVPDADVILVCVPTPLDSDFDVDLSNVEAVFDSLAPDLSPNTPVIIESTIPPGTTKQIGKSVIKSGSELHDSEIHLAHCPERIDPGSEDEWPLESIPRVYGGVTPEAADRTREFYSRLLDADLHEVENACTAACTKIVENSFRDINIAFVNELAKSLLGTDIDVYDVLDGAGTKPYGFMQFEPGPGVGGHCIPVDPYMIINQSKREGYDHDFLQLARQINDGMPRQVMNHLQDVLNSLGMPINGTRITQLGLSFKGGVGDLRYSPALKVKELLDDRDAEIESYDPYVPQESSLTEPYTGTDVVLILTDHPEFAELDYEQMSDKGAKLVYDAKNMIDEERVTDVGMKYANLSGDNTSFDKS